MKTSERPDQRLPEPLGAAVVADHADAERHLAERLAAAERLEDDRITDEDADEPGRTAAAAAPVELAPRPPNTTFPKKMMTSCTSMSRIRATIRLGKLAPGCEHDGLAGHHLGHDISSARPHRRIFRPAPKTIRRIGL